MPFLQHLEELRWRLVRAAIAVLICTILLFWQQSWIMDNVFLIMLDTNFISFRLMCEWFGICTEPVSVEIQSMNVSGQFSYALLTSILGGVVIASPYIFYQLWLFIKPGLKENERKASSGLIFYVSLLFLLGILFGYFVITPLAIQFFGNYSMSDKIQNIFTIDSYMGMMLSTTFYTGLFFLLPIISYLLTSLGVITSDFLRKYRKHAIIVVLILSAVITPPDAISQIIVAIPITILYEIGVFASRRVEKRKNKLS
ncbi:MAG: twin-arginine translocase subunit TatC [Crocinitomicaceae bacterium]|nr:twin-arginine translocase subunit TatC [Crocinitomicaceae bacterium]